MRVQRERTWRVAWLLEASSHSWGSLRSCLIWLLCVAGVSAGGGEEGDPCGSHTDCAKHNYCSRARECSPCRDEDGEALCDLWHDAFDSSCAPCGGGVGTAEALNTPADSALAPPNDPGRVAETNASVGAAAAFNLLGLPQPTFMPTFTDRGFVVVSTPAKLHAHMVKFLQQETDLGRLEQEPPNWKRKAEYNIIPRRNAKDPESNLTSRMADLSEADKAWTLREFQPVVERWAGVKVVPQVCYGIRIYELGATLSAHVDRFESHVLAAIINVAQSSKPWPLVIQDHDGAPHTVELQPGQSLLYEAARLIHARPTPLIGNNFSNAFVHFKPVDWETIIESKGLAGQFETYKKERMRILRTDTHWHRVCENDRQWRNERGDGCSVYAPGEPAHGFCEKDGQGADIHCPVACSLCTRPGESWRQARDRSRQQEL